MERSELVQSSQHKGWDLVGLGSVCHHEAPGLGDDSTGGHDAMGAKDHLVDT